MDTLWYTKCPPPNWQTWQQNIQMASRIHISDCAKETEAVAWQVKQQEQPVRQSSNICQAVTKHRAREEPLAWQGSVQNDSDREGETQREAGRADTQPGRHIQDTCEQSMFFGGNWFFFVCSEQIMLVVCWVWCCVVGVAGLQSLLTIVVVTHKNWALKWSNFQPDDKTRSVNRAVVLSRGWFNSAFDLPIDFTSKYFLAFSQGCRGNSWAV